MKLDILISWSSKVNSSMEMKECGLGLFIEIIVLDVSYPRELTLLNLEF
jgi:hypothetical protein